MARLMSSSSTDLEVREGALANLGTARVLLGLVEVRVRHALQSGGMAALLIPALDDLTQADEYIHNAQRAIHRAPKGDKCSR